MMRNIKTYIVSILLLCSTLSASSALALDGKTKALGAMALYGTAGGALLGTASMAFGTSERSIAVGASLGLYAGLIFGSYIVLTHAAKRNNWNFGDPNEYEEAPIGPYNGEVESLMPRTPVALLEEQHRLNRIDQKKTSNLPVFYTDFLKFTF